MSDTTIAVGFSANPEVVVKYDSTLHSAKVPAESFSFGLSGTSVNLCSALREFGHQSLLLATAGNGDDTKTHLLRHLLKRNGVKHVLMPIRQQTNAALVRIDGGVHMPAIGLKSHLVLGKVPNAVKKIQRAVSENVGWRVATGLISDELPLAIALFEGREGQRVLNPRESLMTQPDCAKLVLRQTDVLVCNADEFRAFTGNARVTHETAEAVHGLGVKLLIVTNSSHGAYLSFGGHIAHIPSYTKGGVMVSEVGAGDWFTGGLLGFLCDKGVNNTRQLSFPLVLEAAHFAAVTAGLKVAKSGGNNGPTRTEVEQHLAKA